MEAVVNRLHDKWLEDDREYPRIKAICDECGNEIYVDEDHYNPEGYIVCEDCWMKFSDERFKVRGEC